MNSGLQVYNEQNKLAARPETRKDIETPVVKASREKNIIPRKFYYTEAIAHIMTQKFVMDCLLYRQEQEMNWKGIHLSRQTMSNWIWRAAEDYLTPVLYMSSCIRNFLIEMFSSKVFPYGRRSARDGQQGSWRTIPQYGMDGLSVWRFSRHTCRARNRNLFQVKSWNTD